MDITLDRFMYFLLSLIETVISFRFIFKLFGAPQSNFVISWIYSVSGYLINPFSSLFKEYILGSFVIDINSLVALVVYTFFGYLLIEFLRLLRVTEH